MSRRNWIILGVVAALAAGGAWYFLRGETGLPLAGGGAPVYQPLPTDHTFGNPQAKVTVIEYASPTCPVCANFMINYYPKLKSDYIDSGKIFYVYRTFLRLADDGMAEKLARCMPKDKYMSFTETLFREQSRWDYEFGIPQPDGVHAALVQLAQESGMNAADADRCIASPAEETAINNVGQDGVAKYAVAATPTFVVNGKTESGFQNLFSRIDDALSGK
jgi:protein-disulfide isomerase